MTQIFKIASDTGAISDNFFILGNNEIIWNNTKLILLLLLPQSYLSALNMAKLTYVLFLI